MKIKLLIVDLCAFFLCLRQRRRASDERRASSPFFSSLVPYAFFAYRVLIPLPHPSLAFFLFFPCMIERIHRRLLVFVSKKVFVFMLQPIRDRNSLDHDAGLKTDAPLEWRKSGNRPAVIRSGRREGRSAPSVVRWQRPCSAESRRSTGWLRAASACAWSGK